MTAILGLSAFYHDSAAALVVDGEIVAAAQQERFSRKKHDAGFPADAIAYCLSEAGVEASELEGVAFYEKPLLKFDRLLETYLAYAPRGLRSFTKAMPQWLGQKLHVRREIRAGLEHRYQGPIYFGEHHESHAASAFYPSSFDSAAILTIDGVGEWATTTLGVGRGNCIELEKELRFPHSLGLLYSAATDFAGFEVNSGEYKLMGLAPYGRPIYAETLLQRLIDLRDDGSFRMDMTYFRYPYGLTMTSRKFHQLFGRGPRRRDQPIQQLDMDLAASVQMVAEEVVLRSARHLHQMTGMRNICLAGGVALNCVASGRLLREGPFDEIWVQPAAGDAGGALGVATLIWHQVLGHPRQPRSPDAQHGSLLGPAFSSDQVRAVLDERGAVYRRVDDGDALAVLVAEALAGGKVVGWMQGRMEFGPRALGNRSILGDPRNPEMQSIINRKIKFRESFRPFAPAVLAESAPEYFEIEPGRSSPYMMLVYDVSAAHRVASPRGRPSGLAAIGEVRSDVPAITHVDGSARLQTVDRDTNPVFQRLIRSFYEKTGCPLVINTSFNVRDEPIVCTPRDAYCCFMTTAMDMLVMEDCVLIKEDQPVTRKPAP